MQLQATVQEEVLMLGDGSNTVDIELVRWNIVATPGTPTTARNSSKLAKARIKRA